VCDDGNVSYFHYCVFASVSITYVNNTIYLSGKGTILQRGSK
jgi:hypothetical protein